MGFVRQRDIVRQKKHIKELEVEYKADASDENKRALFEAQNSLKDMLKQNKEYEALFTK